MKKYMGAVICGLCAGTLTGLFGAGGGMVLVPLMTQLTDLAEQQLFPTSVAILFPVCIVSLIFAAGWQSFSFFDALPYLLGSIAGGLLAGTLGKKIPSLWLHRVLGIMILWGGIRYLC